MRFLSLLFTVAGTLFVLLCAFCTLLDFFGKSYISSENAFYKIVEIGVAAFVCFYAAKFFREEEKVEGTVKIPTPLL